METLRAYKKTRREQLLAHSKDEVEAFYRAALAAGGRDNGGPGYRRAYWPGYYAAFVYDLDGHNIEAVWYDYSAENAATNV